MGAAGHLRGIAVDPTPRNDGLAGRQEKGITVHQRCSAKFFSVQIIREPVKILTNCDNSKIVLKLLPFFPLKLEPLPLKYLMTFELS